MLNTSYFVTTTWIKTRTCHHYDHHRNNRHHCPHHYRNFFNDTNYNLGDVDNDKEEDGETEEPR